MHIRRGKVQGTVKSLFCVTKRDANIDKSCQWIRYTRVARQRGH